MIYEVVIKEVATKRNLSLWSIVKTAENILNILESFVDKKVITIKAQTMIMINVDAILKFVKYKALLNTKVKWKEKSWNIIRQWSVNMVKLENRLLLNTLSESSKLIKKRKKKYSWSGLVYYHSGLFNYHYGRWSNKEKLKMIRKRLKEEKEKWK